ncbi:DegT/DnrJ/EryC1/StrS family aminotransferase [Streptomyces sp. TS71-3]|uniref:DegT/DnrJ/EryC1/StrS family aminotransferase n=1 Tax=Streptomyces sp. TS71-3 TaxID=2733862 RepID=UPI001B18281C|nr:DegT/DnrJ/EryC1/StrS family aminotransferase [Streptomyces sp. TS71-3]GHJ40545.1 hypothetical protein Sm713_61540 [Streptomyces sp. TS71-3]
MGTLDLLRAAGIGAGDEVIVPAFGNVDATEAVADAGALPVFADIHPASYCLDPDAVAHSVGPRTVGVVVVHRFGQPADLAALRTICEKQSLLLLEQTEQEAGFSGVAERRAHAELLNGRLTGVLPPTGCPEHTYEQYVVRVPGNGRPDRDAFARALRARGVTCRVPVKTPVHRMPRFRRDISLPETERAADETLAIPVDAALCARDMRRIISACNSLGGLLQPA